MGTLSEGLKIGGPGKVVCTDETWFTKKKRNKGGFQGRTTLGQTVMDFGAVELQVLEDGRRQETGRVVLKVLQDRAAATIASIFAEHVAHDSVVFTDGGKEFSWLDSSPHYRMRQRNKHFPSSGGVWSRMKHMLRNDHATPTRQEGYADFMGEFLWRTKFLRKVEEETWRRQAFAQALKAVHLVHKAHAPNNALPPPQELVDFFAQLRAQNGAPRKKRQGGRYGKRVEELAITNGEEVMLAHGFVPSLAGHLGVLRRSATTQSKAFPTTDTEELASSLAFGTTIHAIHHNLPVLNPLHLKYFQLIAADLAGHVVPQMLPQMMLGLRR
eukprot:2250236-Amphidinium_carterae.1